MKVWDYFKILGVVPGVAQSNWSDPQCFLSLTWQQGHWPCALCYLFWSENSPYLPFKKKCAKYWVIDVTEWLAPALSSRWLTVGVCIAVRCTGVVLQLEVVSVAFCGWRHIGQTHLDSSRDAVEESEDRHILTFHPCSFHFGWLNNKACLAKDETAKMTMRRRRMVLIGYLFESAHTKQVTSTTLVLTYISVISTPEAVL